MILGTGKPGFCLGNNSAGNLPPAPDATGPGSPAGITSITSIAGSEATIQRSESAPFAVSERSAFQQDPDSPLSTDSPESGFPGQIRISRTDPEMTIIDWSDTSLYPVSVTSNHLLNIPGVLDDCGLEDRVFERKVICSKDPNHFSYIKSGNSCGDPGCLRHWVTWARQAADRIGFRVEGFRNASRTRYPARKIILSIDDENPIIKTWRARGEIDAVKKARVYFIKKARKIGCKGGSMTIHLWRTNDKVPGYIKDQKRWDWVRSQGPRWREYVKYSPHAHVIGYGYLKRPDQDDFEYKNMGPLNTREEIESVAYYNVSHAPVGPGITAVIYFGCCSYGKLRCVFKTQIHLDDFCPECGAVLVFEDTGEVAQRVRTWGDFKIDQGGTESIKRARGRLPAGVAVSHAA